MNRSFFGVPTSAASGNSLPSASVAGHGTPGLIAKSFGADSSPRSDALRTTASIKSPAVLVNEFVNVRIVGWLDADE